MAREIISRRGDDGNELLADHSEAVQARGVGLVDIESESQQQALEAACRLHDFGKVTTYFQRHIRDKYVEYTQRTYHARLGGLATFFVLDELGIDTVDTLAGTIAVLRHHGRIPNAAEHLFTIAQEEYDGNGYARSQIADIQDDPQSRAVADDLLRRASDDRIDWTSFAEASRDGDLFRRLETLVSDTNQGGLPDMCPDKLPPGLYDRVFKFWSALTLADKTCASGIESEYLRPDAIALEALEGYIADLRSDAGLSSPPSVSPSIDSLPVTPTDEDTINQTREALRRLTRKQAKTFADSGADIGTITLPTGLGKTFTGITAAYTIRDATAHTELGAETSPRVVYALPYTSIIEQTRQVFEESLGADARSAAFTVHHYLSETLTFPEVNRDGDEDESKADPTADSEISFDPSLLGESWRSGTVLTTFVQLFDSIAGPTNSAGLKASALTDSVIILDEPQTLPKPWWEAIRRLCHLLVDEYNVRIISMTATQPSLFTHVDRLEVTSLLGDDETPPLVDAAFDAMERVVYEVDTSLEAYPADDALLTHERAGERLLADAMRTGGSGSSTLAVCNTIASVRELTEATEQAARRSGHNVCRLGASVTEMSEALSPGDITDPDDRPSATTVARRVLDDLGVRPTEGTRTEDFEDVEWVSKNPDEASLFLGCLTSRHRPRDRRVLVSVISALSTTDVPFVFVSTQAIEAGVDVSFSSVFRDIAPLDSIVQAAGRCNRSFEWGAKGGRVIVWGLEPVEDGDPPATYVYKPNKQLKEVAEILQRTAEGTDPMTAPESEMARKAVPEYFDWIEGEDLEDRELTEAITRCDGDTLKPKHLIEESYESRDVLVPRTDEEYALVEQISEGLTNHDRSRAFELLQGLSDIRVSVPVSEIEEVSQQITRLDKREFDDPDGVDTLTLATHDNTPYSTSDCGFVVFEDDIIESRFT